MTSNEIKKAVISSTTYKIGKGFLLDIVCNAEYDPQPQYQAWFWHKDFGVKELLYGANQEYDDFIDTALYYAEDFKDYYAEKYMLVRAYSESSKGSGMAYYYEYKDYEN